MRAVRTLLAFSLLFGMVAAGSAESPTFDNSGQVAQTYIVVFDDAVTDVRAEAARLSTRHGGTLGFVYEHALKGFSVEVSAAGAAALANSPRVAYVEADQEVTLAADTSSVPVPTGIDRINADQNPNLDIDGTDDLRVDAVVAVIDTGIDFDHPDLNVDTANSVNCASGSPFRGSCTIEAGDDDNGHGTHVAGTIGALDNGADYGDVHVVGAAPGATQWAIKVLRSDGSGYISWIVAGIDYVTANAEVVDVANMSLGCECSSQAMDDAIAESVAAGVAYAVAAGNSAEDASTFSPANHPDVITVSALADFDGEPGAEASPTCRNDEDDTLANFSNFGDLVEVTAPGVCILSAWNDGGYNIISGTSMASPHAAGAAALLAASGTTSPADIQATLIDTGNTDDWTDEVDGKEEPRVDVADETVFNPAMLGDDSENAVDDNSPPTASFTFSCTDLACDFDDTSTDSDGSVESWLWEFGDGSTSTAQNPSHTYEADGTYTVTLTVTDDDGETDSDSQDVSVSESSSNEVTLSGSSINNGSTWTAVVTVTGPEGEYSGTWDLDSSKGSCTIGNGETSCTIELTGIHKRVSSVTYTDDSDPDLSITISKP